MILLFTSLSFRAFKGDIKGISGGMRLVLSGLSSSSFGSRFHMVMVALVTIGLTTFSLAGSRLVFALGQILHKLNGWSRGSRIRCLSSD